MIAHSAITGIIARFPQVAGVLERYQIDFMPDSEQTLSDVCQGDALRLYNIVREIHLIQIHRQPYLSSSNWEDMSMKELCRYIVEQHHTYIKSALPALVVHSFQVAGRFVEQMPQLDEIKSVLTKIRAEFTHHMMKEEEILFPRIIQLEEIDFLGTDVTLNHRMIIDPLKGIFKEHTHADSWVSSIRKLTDDFKKPFFADNLFKQFYRELVAFEADLQMHVYLENEVLFPKVYRLIKKLGY